MLYNYYKEQMERLFLQRSDCMKRKRILAWIMTFVLFFYFCSGSVCAAPDTTEKRESSSLIAFITRGENKIETVEEDCYDYYLNNLVWGGVRFAVQIPLFLGVAAIPVLPKPVGIFSGLLLSGVAGSLMTAKNGVIIRCRMIDVSCGIGAPRYVYRILKLEEQ